MPSYTQLSVHQIADTEKVGSLKHRVDPLDDIGQTGNTV